MISDKNSNPYLAPSVEELRVSALSVVCTTGGGVNDLVVNPLINGDEDCED